MMKIEIGYKFGEHSKSLAVENIQTELANKIIDGFFGQLLPKRSIVKPEPNKPTATENVENITVIKPTRRQTVQKPPKLLPKVNGERSLYVPIEEILEAKQEQEDAPEHWKTGIIYHDGDPRYRTKYWCDCGNQGKRYIEKDAEYIHCHECNQKLLVEPATLATREDGLPERDEWGNFYIAREALEDEGE